MREEKEQEVSQGCEFHDVDNDNIVDKPDMIFIEVWDIRLKNDAGSGRHDLETHEFYLIHLNSSTLANIVGDILLRTPKNPMPK